MANFRHEIKLLLSYPDYLALKPKLSALLPTDPNAGPSGEYFIRSLYFDDVNKTSYFEKLAGVADRKKYRVRIYNQSDETIKLECKEKRGDRIRKRSTGISRECAEKMSLGDFSLLDLYDDPLCREVSALAHGKLLRPSVVVDYDREAFLHPVSNVRLTFDKALHAGIEGPDIFDGQLTTVPVFADGSIIFEVKYDEVLPKFIQGVIAGARGSKLALSKFTLCRDRLAAFKPKY